MKLLEYCENKNKIYVYGIGKYSEGIELYLNIGEMKVSGYIVSDGYEHPEQIRGLPVYECSALPYSENDCIVIAVSQEFYGAVVSGLVRNGYPNVYFLDASENRVCSTLTKLREKGIDINSEILNISENWGFANIYSNKNKADFGDIRACTCEMGDLVFPYLGDESGINEGVYEYGNVTVDKGDIVFDCGANIGIFASRAASVVGGMGTIYAFEPLPQALKYLNMTKEVYGEKIKIVKSAVADKKGTMVMEMSPINLGGASIVQKKPFGMKLNVDVITLDDFVRDENLEHVDFIKADIEGAERLMLQGAQKVLKEFAPKLSLCTYHLFDDVSVMTDLILKANPNYKIFYGWRKMYAWVEKDK